MIRLQKILAASGLASRRAAETAITAGRVQVNGKTITSLGTKADPEKDKITLDGKPVSKALAKTLILFHKPRGVVTTKSDPYGRMTVMKLLPQEFKHLNPVGRLDFESEGLLLLTNDGELALHFTHPRYGVEKEYQAQMEGKVELATLKKWKTGVELDDGVGAFLEASVIRFEGTHTWVKIIVNEGRNRFIRRMADALGHPVRRLVRVRVGKYRLIGLPSGKHREVPIPKC